MKGLSTSVTRTGSVELVNLKLGSFTHIKRTSYQSFSNTLSDSQRANRLMNAKELRNKNNKFSQIHYGANSVN